MISILFWRCFSSNILANKNLCKCFTAVCEILIVQRVLRGQETFLLFAWIKTFYLNSRKKAEVVICLCEIRLWQKSWWQLWMSRQEEN
jgi:hypothetical protein